MKLPEPLRWLVSDASPRAKRLRQLLKLAFVLILFLILNRFVDFKVIFEVIAGANLYYVLAGYVVYIGSIYLTALQFKILAKQEDILLSLNQVVAINLSIMFYLIFLPGAVVGSGLRWYKVSQVRGKPTESFAAVVFNRLYDMFLIVVFGIGFWLLSDQSDTQSYAIGLFFILFLIALLWIGVTKISVPFSNFVNRLVTGTQEGTLLHVILGKTLKLLKATAVYGSISKTDLFSLVIVGIARLLVGLVVYILLARSVGIYLPMTTMGWIRSVVLLFAFIPFTIAGGLGIREIGLIAMLSGFGISAEVAVAFSIMLLAQSVFFGLVGGVIEAVDAIRKSSYVRS